GSRPRHRRGRRGQPRGDGTAGESARRCKGEGEDFVGHDLAPQAGRGRRRSQDSRRDTPEGHGRIEMTARIIDGKVIASELRARVAEEVARVKRDHQLTPGLAVVLVGNAPASEVYVRSKHTQTQAAGMASFEHKLPADVAQADLLALIAKLNADPAVHGILVQLPLPKT